MTFTQKTARLGVVFHSYAQQILIMSISMYNDCYLRSAKNNKIED